MLDPQLLETLKSVVAPALGGVILLALLWRPWSGGARDERTNPAPPPPTPAGWMTALPLGAAFVAAIWIAHGFPGLWSVDVFKRLHWAAVAGVLVALIDARRSPGWLAPAGAVVASLFLVWILTEHRRDNGVWEGRAIWGWTAAWTLAVAGGWMALTVAAARRSGPVLPFVLSLVATVQALGLVQAGLAAAGQLGGLLSAWLGFAFLLALLNPRFTLARGGAHVLGACMGALTINGYTLAPTPIPYAGLGLLTLLPLVALPAALLLPARRDGQPDRWWRRPALDLAILAPLAAAILVLTRPPAPDPSEPNLDDLYGVAAPAPPLGPAAAPSGALWARSGTIGSPQDHPCAHKGRSHLEWGI